MDPDGMVALLNYREDGITRTSQSCAHNDYSTIWSVAYFVFWKEGLKEEKL